MSGARPEQARRQHTHPKVERPAAPRASRLEDQLRSFLLLRFLICVRGDEFVSSGAKKRNMGDEAPPLYPGFEEDARTWGLQTSAGQARELRAPHRGVDVFSPRVSVAAGLTRDAVPLGTPPPGARCAGIGVGVVLGWAKGLKESAHLAGTYGLARARSPACMQSPVCRFVSRALFRFRVLGLEFRV